MRTTLPCPTCQQTLTFVATPAALACPFCRASMRFPAGKIPVGKKVCCGKCRGVFTAESPPPGIRVFASTPEACPFCHVVLAIRKDLATGKLVRCFNCQGTFRPFGPKKAPAKTKLGKKAGEKTKLTMDLAAQQAAAAKLPPATALPASEETYFTEDGEVDIEVVDEAPDSPPPEEEPEPPRRRPRHPEQSPRRRAEAELGPAAVPAPTVRAPADSDEEVASTEAASETSERQASVATPRASAAPHVAKTGTLPAPMRGAAKVRLPTPRGPADSAADVDASPTIGETGQHSPTVLETPTHRPGSPVPSAPARKRDAADAPAPAQEPSTKKHASEPLPKPKGAVAPAESEPAAAASAKKNAAADDRPGSVRGRPSTPPEPAQMKRGNTEEDAEPEPTTEEPPPPPPTEPRPVPRPMSAKQASSGGGSGGLKLLGLIFAALLLVGGLGGGVYFAFFTDGFSKQTVYATEGIVLYKGKPAAGARVTLFPDVKTRDRYFPTGKTNADGAFTLTTYEAGDGAPAGKYRVTIVRGQIEADEYAALSKKHSPEEVRQISEKMAKDPLYSKYSNPRDSKLSAEITSSTPNRLEFKLD